MKKIFIINGPNLNFLGIRETGIYGNDNYDSLCSYIQEKFYDKNVKIEIFQSNYEGRIIDILQNAYYEKIDGIIINPGAYTHYSYAIHDAIKAVSIPTVTFIKGRNSEKFQLQLLHVCYRYMEKVRKAMWKQLNIL